MQDRDYEPGDLSPAEHASELASRWIRLAAVIIDGLILYLVPGLILFVGGISAGASSGVILFAVIVFIVILIIQMVLVDRLSAR